MKSKKGIIIAILVLAIGFATVSTTLILNGTLGIGADTGDFQVYFSGAVVEDVDMTNEVIKNQGQEIIYTSGILNKAGQTSRLDYEVTNGSTQYGADVTIECFLADLDDHKLDSHDYLEIMDGYTNEMQLEPGETKPGYVTVRLKKSSTENDETKKLRCVMIANATEKDSYGNPVPAQGTYALSGYFVNEDGTQVSNAYLAVYSEEMHIVKTDLYGYFYVDGLERGLHEVYYLNSLNPTGLTKEEVRTYSYGEVKVATNNNSDIEFTNKYKITDTAINNSNNKTNKTYDITLNPDGGTLANTTFTITENTRYGELPVPTRDGYNFNGWYLGEKLVNSDIIVTSDNISELKAKWSANDYIITFNANGGSLANTSDITKTIKFDTTFGTLPEPTRTGYTFDGWYKNTTKIESTTTYIYAENIELEAKWTLNSYTVTFNASGGSVSIPSKIVQYSTAYGDLPIPTRSEYKFLGWYYGEKQIIKDNVYNEANDITLIAQWQKVEWNYTYTGGEQEFTAPKAGNYRLEIWGAQGGCHSDINLCQGYGGYSTGTIYLSVNEKIYVNIGGAGIGAADQEIGYNQKVAGGYNGGGDAYTWTDSKYVGSGGGATHIAYISGILSSLESTKENIISVAGGGGGTGSSSGYDNLANNLYAGSGGGYVGGTCALDSTGGTQTTPGEINKYTDPYGAGTIIDMIPASFGQGGSDARWSDNSPGNTSGGGGGYYGGASGFGLGGFGAGGSGYIGNENLTNKVMYCYNCTESNVENIRTISTTNVSETPTSYYAKIGNGYARITYLEN